MDSTSQLGSDPCCYCEKVHNLGTPCEFEVEWPHPTCDVCGVDHNPNSPCPDEDDDVDVIFDKQGRAYRNHYQGVERIEDGN